MPEDIKDEKPYLDAMISEAMRNRSTDGFILANSTPLMQRLFRESGLPTVVFGNLYRSVDGMSYMDRDQKQIGRLIAEYLLGKGHDRIVMITRNRRGWGPGEYLVADAVGEVAEKAGLPAGALVNRSVPHDHTIVREEIRHVLENSKSPPGILVRPWQMVEAIYEAIESVGLVPQQDVAVGIADYFDTSAAELPYPVIRSEWTMEQQGNCLGKLLNQRSQNSQAEPEHKLIPLRLEVPESLTTSST